MDIDLKSYDEARGIASAIDKTVRKMRAENKAPLLKMTARLESILESFRVEFEREIDERAAWAQMQEEERGREVAKSFDDLVNY